MPDPNIARRRLLAQRVAGQKLETPADVVRWLGAMQAQDYGASLWAVGVRTSASVLSDIASAVERREIARTWPMRGTLHWVPAEDLRWMVALMAPRAIAKAAGRSRQLEVDERVVSQARATIERALRDGASITRPEAYALVAASNIPPDGQRGIHILQRLAHEGVICFGPHRGKQPTFVLVDDWLPASRPKQRTEAVTELARRYFASHGPATLHDFAWWTGLTVTEAREGMASARAEFESAHIDGKEYLAPGEQAGSADAGVVHLLPSFDEFILGYTDRSAVLSPEQAKRLIPGKNGMFLAAMVADSGEVLGTWSKSAVKAGVRVVPERFDGSPGVSAALDAAARRYAGFLGLEPA